MALCKDRWRTKRQWQRRQHVRMWMRIELATDLNASRAMHMPVMAFRVHLALGERPTPELMAALERSAAEAREIVELERSVSMTRCP
jgi:hypothetical protein